MEEERAVTSLHAVGACLGSSSNNNSDNRNTHYSNNASNTSVWCQIKIFLRVVSVCGLRLSAGVLRRTYSIWRWVLLCIYN